MIAANGFAQGVIDVHSHIITPEFVSALETEGRVMDEGFPLPKYNVENHLRWMDEAGVETSVLTLAAPQPSSAEVVRQTNETAARIKKEHPGRFLFCAALPLPDVSKAIEEAKFALDVLKADGIKLATNVNGQYLGAPELDTLFSVLNERKAIVILHPHRPEPVNKQVMQQTPLAMQEYLSETTRAVSNMISRNVLARYNDIKVVVPHCGAYLPLAIPRMKSLTPVMQTNKMVGEIDYEANLRTLYYDLAGAHSPEVIHMLLTITTPDHLLYGSDYPYVAPQVLTQSLARMKDYLSKEPDLAPFKEMILWKNAQSLTQSLSTPLHHREGQGGGSLIVRIAEIEVYPQYLQEYLAFANEVDRLSIEREPGVICLYPMQSAEDSTKIRILEIYASDEAYQQHLKTEHFQKYKQGTLHMVKDLKLPTMKPLDPETMKLIFKKQR
ncbi:amidohydrolase family protein [Prevotella communis]|uniref:amidohydrolase family protein n=1 Tax=Prevotella communis TaxID=2913614 RepID=UPI001EDC4C85|nr:amidohydrolase family protein [Prevotella communis]UKK60450.1 amidohydrolase family protein [Prevotella communis]UKK68430.1 amidohydrolase family protein [Prevotella communis]UKK69435.1 amidohydrolase family protein [Prevotella communis]